MNDTDVLRSSLSKLINRYGVEKVKLMLNEATSEHETMEQREFRCMCGSTSCVTKQTVNGSLYLLLCNRCKQCFIAYYGTTRTKRQTRDISCTKVTIRSYDANGAERAISFAVYSAVRDIELKSKDKFTLVIPSPKESELLVYSRFSNQTLGTTNLYQFYFRDLYSDLCNELRKETDRKELAAIELLPPDQAREQLAALSRAASEQYRAARKASAKAIRDYEVARSEYEETVNDNKLKR